MKSEKSKHVLVSFSMSRGHSHMCTKLLLFFITNIQCDARLKWALQETSKKGLHLSEGHLQYLIIKV